MNHSEGKDTESSEKNKLKVFHLLGTDRVGTNYYYTTTPGRGFIEGMLEALYLLAMFVWKAAIRTWNNSNLK